MLIFARIVFVLVGVGALLAGLGQVQDLLAPGSRFDLFPVAWGVGLGILALAAAAWVTSHGAFVTVLAWAGIVAMLATSLVPIGYLVLNPDSGADVYALALIPTAIGLAATFVMARARWMSRSSAS